MNSTPAGGSIVIAAARETGAATDRDAGTDAAADMLAISVIDDGAGIDADDLPHVFERFYRADRSREAGPAGTGLGLAISRAIVEAHGGTIDVTSEGIGHGVTVTIRFPCESAQP